MYHSVGGGGVDKGEGCAGVGTGRPGKSQSSAQFGCELELLQNIKSIIKKVHPLP